MINFYLFIYFFETFMRACFDFSGEKTGGGGIRAPRVLPKAAPPACRQQWQHHVAGII